MDKIGSKQTKPGTLPVDVTRTGMKISIVETRREIAQDPENEARANGDSRRPIYSLPAASPTRIQMLSRTFNS